MMGMVGKHNHCVEVNAAMFSTVPIEEGPHDTSGFGQIRWIAAKYPLGCPERQVCIDEYDHGVHWIFCNGVVQEFPEPYAHFFVRLLESRPSQHSGPMSALSFD
jgi:hypothetical protein